MSIEAENALSGPLQIARGRATRKLSRMTAADKCPTLSNDDLLDLVDDHCLHEFWAANLAVQVGYRIVGLIKNGRVYKAIRGGQTGAEEPIWPRNRYLLVEDGDVIWEDAGPAPPHPYDLQGAACDGWKQKAANCAHYHDFSDGGQKLSREQVYHHCLEMAASFETTASAFIV